MDTCTWSCFRTCLAFVDMSTRICKPLTSRPFLFEKQMDASVTLFLTPRAHTWQSTAQHQDVLFQSFLSTSFFCEYHIAVDVVSTFMESLSVVGNIRKSISVNVSMDFLVGRVDQKNLDPNSCCKTYLMTVAFFGNFAFAGAWKTRTWKRVQHEHQ